jgi:hypothetical protein
VEEAIFGGPILTSLELAWEKGQALFQGDLTRAMANEEEIEYLSEVDFAVDCFAQAATRIRITPRFKPGSRVDTCCALRHFLTDEGTA